LDIIPESLKSVSKFLKSQFDQNNSNVSEERYTNVSEERYICCRSCGSTLKRGFTYCPECKTILPLEDLKIINHAEYQKIQDELKKKEMFQKVVTAQLDKAKENINKLRDSENLIYIDNYAKKYSKQLMGTVTFENLRELLKTKQFNFTTDELEMIIRLRHSNIKYNEVKAKLLENNPVNADECIRKYLALFWNNVNESIIRQILIEQFNYNGDVEKDIARIRTEIVQKNSDDELKKFESDLLGEVSISDQVTISDVDRISGYDFEVLLKRLFEKMGYQAIHTPLSNDQGADLVLEKEGTRFVVQAKNWTANVGNSAVQEIVPAVKHYNAHKAIVISSSGFTASAIELARSNNVELWDRSRLSRILEDNPIYPSKDS
jgi:uncharacterized Zn finger protein (UPF0148 family)